MAHRDVLPIREGLSPRVRGNRGGRRDGAADEGSIPACAGEPGSPPPRPRRCWVYPRVCGGTTFRNVHKATGPGLSPRVRGNPRTRTLAYVRSRSIPACAGEPSAPPRAEASPGVYPRVCGGTGVIRYARRCTKGLSPRVRGNPRCARGAAPRFRSIPACAGEPTRSTSGLNSGRVYPRVCGGTPCERVHSTIPSGLSPRVRGNRNAARAGAVSKRSIPACAGEPRTTSGMFLRAWVYPRVCGGTGDARLKRLDQPGLSPRVRGNPRRRVGVRPQHGSIPACAGEPTARHRARLGAGVYPRVCGGTARPDVPRLIRWGLSPRVRGNPVRWPSGGPNAGSIPACAGEPSGAARSGRGPRVYPRVCGGTIIASATDVNLAGLSPRVRGNR